MFEEKCKHKWEKVKEADWESGTGDIQSKYKCKKCNAWLHAGELYQYEALKINTKTISVLIITTVVAFVALIVSLISLAYQIK